jgi:hypothetical protein
MVDRMTDVLLGRWICPYTSNIDNASIALFWCGWGGPYDNRHIVVGEGGVEDCVVLSWLTCFTKAIEKMLFYHFFNLRRKY